MFNDDNAIGRRQVRRPHFVFPKGSDGPTHLNINPSCSFVIIIDGDVHRDMLDLGGPGGPDDFDIPVAEVVAAATKVVIAVGGPSDHVRAVMSAVDREDGYSVVVETSAARFVTWAREVIAARGTSDGVALIGPRKHLPQDLQERCLVDTDYAGRSDVAPGALLN
jgi:hypothetical protein